MISLLGRCGLAILSVFFVANACFAQKNGADHKPPKAAVKPKKLEIHGDVRTDNYYWLKERENQEVIDYLNAENEYTDKMSAHMKDLQEEIFQEIKGRIKEDDSSVPYRQDGYFYYTRFEEGKEYPIYCRKKGSLEAAEEVMLDVNQMAEGHDFFAVRGRAVSAKNNILAYAVDTKGRRIYNLEFKNLETGEILPDKIESVTGNMAWGNDNKTLFYSKQDLTTLRSYQIYRHTLGSDPANDELIYEEKDETFRCFVWRTKSKKFIMIGSSPNFEQRISLSQCGQARRRIHALRRARTQPRVQHRSLRRSFLYHHESQRQKFPLDENACDENGGRKLDGGDSAPRRRLSFRL